MIHRNILRILSENSYYIVNLFFFHFVTHMFHVKTFKKKWSSLWTFEHWDNKVIGLRVPIWILRSPFHQNFNRNGALILVQHFPGQGAFGKKLRSRKIDQQQFLDSIGFFTRTILYQFYSLSVRFNQSVKTIFREINLQCRPFRRLIKNRYLFENNNETV